MTTKTAPMTFVVAPRVITKGSHYIVLFGDEEHIVMKDRSCRCGTQGCLAIRCVEDYLRNGGRRAPDPAPPCPVCGGDTVIDRSTSTAHTTGWTCTNGGRQHFWMTRSKVIQEGMKARKWAFLPAEGYAGIPMRACTARRISEESWTRWNAMGYDPTA